MDALTVSRAESGQKLLNFLQRRIEAAAGELHKWIRSGQVRVNGGRSKAFDRVSEGDLVRVPPFAALKAPGSASPVRPRPASAIAFGGAAILPVIYEDEDILVLNKPSGLPSQGGTGHADSVASLLAARFRHAEFVPAPVHRLDKDTSGLLIAGKSYAALRRLSDALAGRTETPPRKEYLAWVWGRWPHAGESELRDRMEKNRQTERMETGRTEGKEARSIVRALETRDVQGRTATLMLVRLLTGRTHQIRVQFASRGYPLAGDSRYGRPDGERLRLHAFRLTLMKEGRGTSSLSFRCLPSWNSPWELSESVVHACGLCNPTP